MIENPTAFRPDVIQDSPLAAILRRYQGIEPSLVNLNSEEAAPVMGLKAKTLEGWRWKGKGPRFTKLGRYVSYNLADILTYIERNRFSSTREAKTARRKELLQQNQGQPQ